jgi:chemotaxis protein histidine kinase CheA
VTSPEAEARLAALARDYALRLPERVMELQSALAALARHWDAQAADGLRRGLHNLAGSGGAYGHAAISRHARAAELMVAALGQHAPDPAALAQIHAELSVLGAVAEAAAAAAVAGDRV